MMVKWWVPSLEVFHLIHKNWQSWIITRIDKKMLLPLTKNHVLTAWSHDTSWPSFVCQSCDQHQKAATVDSENSLQMNKCVIHLIQILHEIIVKWFILNWYDNF